jgi:type I restriction enzyme, R subunit
MTYHQYLTLLQRYKELDSGRGGGGGGDIPFEIDSHITEKDTGKIDADYMNSRFEKYLKFLQSGDLQAKEATLGELHRSFSSLSQEEQKTAEIFLRDIQRGDVQIDPARTLRDYLADYQAKAKNHQVDMLVALLGVNRVKLVALMNTHVTLSNLNEFGRFDDLKASVDQHKAKIYFEGLEGKELPLFRVNMRSAKHLQNFIMQVEVV